MKEALEEFGTTMLVCIIGAIVLVGVTVFIKETGMTTTLKELGTTREMLPLIANSSDIDGFYRKLSHDEILEILEECYE